MNLGHYYGLVFDKTTSTYLLLKIQRIRNSEPAVEAYTRWVKELEQVHKGRYATMGLSFGVLKIEYDDKNKIGVVKVGFSELGLVTPKPSIMSTAFTGILNQPMYLSGKPNSMHTTESLTQIRDALMEHINDVVWSM